MTASPESTRFSAGQLIGDKYRLLRRIDEGGMGTVWEAYNADLDHTVAIKLMRAELAESAAAGRMMHEARVLAPLVHPSIIRVFDCGRTAERIPYIVMELLSGECLADRLEREVRLDPMQAVRLLLPVADAIGVAHDRGVVHRDLKPENVYLADAGNGRTLPKVLDFGIALSDLNHNLRLTTDGSLLGSPQYMSPEQARGERTLDSKSDVWAFAVVLYECISGESPFRRENYHATLRAIIEEEPPSLVDVGFCDALLASIVERGLRKNRSDRWSSMREMGTALAEWLLSNGVSDDAARVSLRSTWIDPAQSSIPPVAWPPSEPPSPVSRQAPTQSSTPTRTPTLGSDTDGIRRLSTGGLSLTTPGGRSRRRSALALGGALVLLAVGAFGWLRHSTQSNGGGTASVAVPLPPPPPVVAVMTSAPALPSPPQPSAEPKSEKNAKTLEPKKPAKSKKRVAPVSRSRRDLINPY